MRICLASIHPRMLSGQIENLIALSHELRAVGHEVIVVSAFPEDTLFCGSRWEREIGDSQSLLGKVSRISRVVRQICAAARKADVVHINLPTPAFSIIGDLVRMMTRRPVVVGYEAHLSRPAALFSDGHLRQAPAFYAPRLVVNNKLIARLTVRHANRYVVSSAMQRNELLEVGLQPEHVAVIPMPIDTGKLQRVPRAQARLALDLPLEQPLVVYVGHYHPVKGVEVLPEALRLLQRTLPDARLVLAWSGIGDRSTVDAAIDAAGIRDSVIEIGRVAPRLAYSAADVVVAPYVLTIGQAAFPAVPLEVMQIGRPLVTSDLPLLRELTREGETAVLSKPGNAASVARGLISLFCDRERAALMVAAQRRLMGGPYHPRMVALRYERLYAAAIRDDGIALRARSRKRIGVRQTGLLQSVGSECELRPAALWRHEWGARESARAGDRRAAA
jgi:glycosyltransferase involved in cell wall biosynthesis